ncbi:hypothetical protein PRIPAC_72442, partial [Pristionchus pacificus]|uniref:Uncharacterized protein n=1 Tax=Pristionchus pacificus TaxID=54126 RepID=A0A2A6C6F1_PRIPA
CATIRFGGVVVFPHTRTTTMADWARDREAAEGSWPTLIASPLPSSVYGAHLSNQQQLPSD